MRLLDVNVLVAAFRPDHQRHAQVREWWKESVAAGERHGVADIVQVGFVRVVTNRRVFIEPASAMEAFGYLTDLLGTSCSRVTAGPRFPELFQGACANAVATGNLVTDAALAALALEHDAEMISLDRDFARFPGLRWSIPGES